MRRKKINKSRSNWDSQSQLHPRSQLQTFAESWLEISSRILQAPSLSQKLSSKVAKKSTSSEMKNENSPLNKKRRNFKKSMWKTESKNADRYFLG